MRILFGIAQNALFITVGSAAKLLREDRKIFFVIVVITGFTISPVDWTETLLINLDVLKTHGSVWTVLKIMFPLVDYGDLFVLLTFGRPFCRVCARRNNHLSSALKCEQCQHFIHKKCSKMSNNLNKIKIYVSAECIAENIPFSHLENDESSELSYNSNFLSNCLDKTIPEKGKNDLKFLNLKELNFKNDLSYIKVDPDENITNFNYFTTHEFHKLSKKTNEKNKSFSI